MAHSKFNIFLTILIWIVLSVVPSYGGQAFNPFTNRLDLCSTFTEEDGDPIAAGCQTIEVTNGTLTDDGDGNFSLSTGGGGGNSFETISVPAGTNPVADSSTDTLTITEGTGLDITGTAGTDTLLFSPDNTEVEATTWGAGGNASNLWTINLSGTDPTLNWVSGGATLVGTLTADALTLGAEENITLGSSTIQEDTTTTDVTISNDLDLEDATPHLRWTDTTANQRDFESYADANQWYLTDVTNSVELIRFNNLNNFFFRGGSVSYSWPSSDGTDGQFLTTNSTGGLSWTTSSGSGDITSVGDCTTGACFDGTQGTTLTFNNASGDQTLIYNVGADLDFNFSDDLNIRDATPHVQFVDTTVSEDDFEFYAQANEFALTNLTDQIEIFVVNAANNVRSRRQWDIAINSSTIVGPTLEGQLAWDSDDNELFIGAGVGGTFETIRIGAWNENGAELGSQTASFDIPLSLTDNSNDLQFSYTSLAISCRNLFAKVAVAPGAGNSWIVTVTDDGVDSGSLNCTISGANTSCTDTTGTTAVITAGSGVEYAFQEVGAATGTDDAFGSVSCYPEGT